jgi:hypothetical protein
MKHSILLSSTALLLVACSDATTPERQHVDSPSQSADRALVAEDSTVTWSAAALDDAASRLLGALPDDAMRRELGTALRALSARLRSTRDGVSESELTALQDRARRLIHLLDARQPSLAADLDAISLAVDHARVHTPR